MPRYEDLLEPEQQTGSKPSSYEDFLESDEDKRSAPIWPKHPGIPSPSPPPQQESLLKRGIHFAGSLALPQAGALLGGGIGFGLTAPEGGWGVLPGISAGSSAGTFANELLSGRTPKEAAIPTAFSAAAPMALGGLARLGGRLGNIPQRAIRFLESMTGEANIKGVGIPSATTGSKLRTAFIRAPDAGLGTESAESRLAGRFAGQVAGRAGALQPETLTQQQLVDQAAEAGKNVDLAPMLKRLYEHIGLNVKVQELSTQRQKLIDLGEEYAKEANPKGAATGKFEVPVNRAREILHELRYKYFDPASTAYQAGKNRAQEALKNSINEAMGPEYARRASVIETKLHTLENMQKRLKPLSATNVISNLWGNSAEDFRKMIRAYDQVHGTNWLEESYKLAIRRDLKPAELEEGKRIGYGLFGAIGWALRALDRPVAKSLAILTRPSGAVAGALTRKPENESP